MKDHDHARYEVLLVKAVDGRLDADEQAELDAHLEDCSDCRAELSDFQLIKQTTDGMRDRILKDAQIEPARPTPPSRAAMGLGFALLLVAALLLASFSLYTLARAQDVPPLVRLAAATAVAGVVVLLAYVLRVRWRARGRDPYEEIDR